MLAAAASCGDSGQSFQSQQSTFAEVASKSEEATAAVQAVLAYFGQRSLADIGSWLESLEGNQLATALDAIEAIFGEEWPMSLRRSSICRFAGLVMAANVAPPSFGSVTLINDDFSAWASAAGAYSTCDFTGFPEWTIITDQYSELGVLFTGPAPNLIHYGGDGIYPQDEWGLDANGILELTFAEPVHAVAGHGPGKWKYKLYLGDSLIGETPFYLGGPGDFAGAISDIAFDRAQLVPAQFNGIVFMDNVYFSAIPAPGAIAVLALGALGFRRRGA